LPIIAELPDSEPAVYEKIAGIVFRLAPDLMVLIKKVYRGVGPRRACRIRQAGEEKLRSKDKKYNHRSSVALHRAVAVPFRKGS
jgi:hypothetical protein